MSEITDKATAIRPLPPPHPAPLKASVKEWVKNLLLTKWGREVSGNHLQTHQQLRSQVLSRKLVGLLGHCLTFEAV